MAGEPNALRDWAYSDEGVTDAIGRNLREWSGSSPAPAPGAAPPETAMSIDNEVPQSSVPASLARPLPTFDAEQPLPPGPQLQRGDFVQRQSAPKVPSMFGQWAGKLKNAQDKEIDVVRQQGQQKADEANRVAEELDNYTKGEEAAAAAAVKRRDDHAKMVSDSMTKMKTITDDYESRTVDPERYWKNKGTGARIGAAIAVAIGAFGAAMTGGKNYALDIINNEVDRDIDAQKSEISKMGQRVNMQTNEIAQLRQMGLDADAAEDVARLNRYRMVENKIKARAAESEGAQAKTQAEGAIAQLQQKQAEIWLRLQKGAESGVKLKNPDSGQQDRVANMNTAMDLLSGLGKDFKGQSWHAFVSKYVPGSDANDFDAKADAVSRMIGEMEQTGVLTDADADFYRRMIPSAQTPKARGEELLKAAMSRLRIKLGNQIKTMGASGVNTQGLQQVGSREVSSFQPR